METIEIWPIREYMRRQQAIIMEYIGGRPIYEFCTGAEHMEGSSRFLRCWYQDYGTNKTNREV